MKTEKIAQTDSDENQIVVYQPDEISRIDVRFERNTVWLTQRQMAELFGCSSDNVGLHLRNIYNEGELVESATAEDSSVVRLEGTRKVVRRVRFYNLDAIISVGFRVNSRRGIQYNLGSYYKMGWGVEKNMEEALKWYRKAADQGLLEANDMLKQLESQQKK